jgi:hypothetical protein
MDTVILLVSILVVGFTGAIVLDWAIDRFTLRKRESDIRELLEQFRQGKR